MDEFERADSEFVSLLYWDGNGNGGDLGNGKRVMHYDVTKPTLLTSLDYIWFYSILSLISSNIMYDMEEGAQT